MPITYDLETDIRFLQGIEKAKMEAVKRALTLDSFTSEQIAYIQGVPIEEVQRIKSDMELDANSTEEVQTENQAEETTDTSSNSQIENDSADSFD